MGIIYKTPGELEKLREANLIVNEILDCCEAAAKPGVSTWELNEVAVREIERHKVTSAFLNYHGYPAVLCTSVNEVVVHGIPSRDDVLKEGDIVGLDFGCFRDGYCGDAARTLAIGEVAPEARLLLEVTKTALERAIEKCRQGSRLQDVGWAVQEYVEVNGFSVVRKYVGHGIGKKLHEDPPVPNIGPPGKGIRLKPGLVLAIEPMVNAGTHEVVVLDDRWTVVTQDRKLSAHFEHSVAVTENEPLVLSRP
ncbi:MAG: type I methionyl aminopeptidase [Pseudomonadota bacterium]